MSVSPVLCSSIRIRPRFSSTAASLILALFGSGSTLAGWSWDPPPRSRSVCWIVVPFSMCYLVYLLFELTYCCSRVGVDCDRVRGRLRDEDMAVVAC